MSKLDRSVVEWIIREKRKGVKNKTIADTAKVSVRHVQRLWRRYKNASKAGYPLPMGRPANGLPGRREHSAVLSAAEKKRSSAGALEEIIGASTGIHIPHNTIHSIMKGNGLASDEPKKKGRRKWVRYEREHSNSMWHTDYKQLDDGRWFIAYQDDASRFVTGYGVFDNATTKNALAVLREAIRNHGKPASVLTDHGSQFYANESEVKKKGESEFEKNLVALNIRHVLARVRHPQTNGKLERLHGELQRKVHRFKDVAGPPGTGAPIGVRKIKKDEFSDFLRAAHAHFGKPIMMILDRAPQHKAKIIQETLKGLGGAVKLEFLPPGCPDLNAIEEVWRQMKHAILDIPYVTVAGMHEDIGRCLGSLVPALDIEKYLYRMV